MKHASNVRIIRLMCSGRVDPQFIVDALAKGADAVLIGGCHPNDCHYAEGNYKCLRRFQMLKRMIADMGLEPERLRLEQEVADLQRRRAEIVTGLVALRDTADTETLERVAREKYRLRRPQEKVIEIVGEDALAPAAGPVAGE